MLYKILKNFHCLICRIVADNVDLEIASRIQTKGAGNRSLHWNHQFAVLDRVNPGPLTDGGHTSRMKVELCELLPDTQVQKNLIRRMAVLVSRVVTTYLKSFQGFSNVVVRHIPHLYSNEMSKKSDSVSAIDK